MKINFRRLWQLTLIVAMLALFVGIAIDRSDVNQYVRRVSYYIEQGDYEQALRVGERSDKTNRQLMLLRIDAMAHQHQLGDRLFSYPIVGRSGDMASRGGDYELCAYLIDKQLDRFVAALPKYYSDMESLPRYYREALVLYNHLRSTPAIVYHDNVLDTDYRDMQQLERKYPNRKARHMAVFQQYEATYWYYYEYLNLKVR